MEKTVFATKLTQYLKSKSKAAIYLSIDGFHFNKTHRYRQGRDSAKGYYEDCYDEQSFTKKVLLSLQESPSIITTATHDLATDNYLKQEPIENSDDAILTTYYYIKTLKNNCRISG